MEGLSNQEIPEKDPQQKRFESYMRYFSLTEEEVRGPILDVGSGDGGFVEYLRTKLGNDKAFGIESQGHRFDKSKDYLVWGDALHMPFDDEMFDTVVAKNYLPMFVNYEGQFREAIREMLRVTKTGGKIMADIATPSTIEEDIGLAQTLPGTERWMGERHKESKDLQDFLRVLSVEGHEVDQIEAELRNSKAVVLRIRKKAN